jgi:hypothetical protein
VSPYVEAAATAKAAPAPASKDLKEVKAVSEKK